MKPSQFRSLLVGLVLSVAAISRAPAASPQEELEGIFERAVAKAQAGQASESDLARELNQLSDLRNKYRSQKAIAADVLLTRAIIYEKIIKDQEMALVIYTEVATEYPGTQAAAVAASTVEAAVATADDRPSPRERSSGQKSSGASSRNPSSPRSTSSSREGRSSATSGSAPARVGSTPEVGNVFPDFSLQDLDGAPLTLAQFRGQMVLVDFWATSCSSCVEEMDNVMAAYRRFHRKGFEIVGVNLDRDRAPLKNFIRARTITWPQFFDDGGAIARRYGITSPPASFLLDREGKIVAVNLRGYGLERALQKYLEP